MPTPESVESLRQLYGQPSGRASKKVLTKLEKHSRNFISTSPFLVLSSFDEAGRVDTSPRGGNPGFVKVVDDHHILIPDAKGNNIIDSLSNIAETGRVGILFLIPGIDETLRVNGSAKITTDQDVLSMFSDETHLPKACIHVNVEEVFLHCAKAFMRSKLWDISSQVHRPDFPTMGRMLNDQLGETRPEESHEDMIKRYQKDL